MLSTKEKQAFYDTAIELRILNPQWLIDLVQFETGNTFSPTVKNPVSSAKGLIQFIDSTARNLGYADSLDLVTKNPTIESQLKGPVYDYLRPYSPFNEEYQLYMAVFFPAARKYGADTSFKTIYQKVYGSNWESRYENFVKSNPGILTPRDYVNLLKKKAGIQKLMLPVTLIIAVGVIFYYIKRNS